MTEDKAKVDVQNTEQHVRVAGRRSGPPEFVIELRAPVSGTIVEQNIAGFEGIKSLDNSPNLFTIADLSQVWVVCDVYENDLGEVDLGDPAEIVSTPILSKRIPRAQWPIFRACLIPTAFRESAHRVGKSEGRFRPEHVCRGDLPLAEDAKPRLVVPSTAIMRLQDKDWVFRKEGDNQFRKSKSTPSARPPTECRRSRMASLKPEIEVVANALEFSTRHGGDKVNDSLPHRFRSAQPHPGV